MSDRYTAQRVNPVTCEDCGAFVADTEKHNAFHDRLDRLASGPVPIDRRGNPRVVPDFDNPPEPAEPAPPACAVCGEPVAWTGDPTAPNVALFHLDRQATHAATLTLPEPPVGTPVWWDGKWWVRVGAWMTYATFDGFESRRAWFEMPGAIPASIPKETA